MSSCLATLYRWFPSTQLQLTSGGSSTPGGVRRDTPHQYAEYGARFACEIYWRMKPYAQCKYKLQTLESQHTATRACSRLRARTSAVPGATLAVSLPSMLPSR